MGSDLKIRHDAEAERIAESYRLRFRHGPLGRWETHDERFVGCVGFDAVVGLGCVVTFNRDGFGLLTTGGSERFCARFQWEPVTNCGLRLRVTECDRAGRHYLDNSDFQWQSLEYDFFLTTGNDLVYLIESQAEGVQYSDPGFWYSVNPLVWVAEPEDLTPPLAGYLAEQ